MVTRGRPRKVIVPEEEKTIQSIIAEVAHDWCSMPGCSTKQHLQEASEIIEQLKMNGYQITELK